MRLLSLLLCALLLACTRQTTIKPADAYDKLSDDISYLLDDPNLANAHIGLYIERVNDGRIIYKQNEYRLFVPASNQKLYTSACALDKLGPDFRFETAFYARGEVSNDTLYGDLIVRGKGDPTISGRFHDGDVLACFKQWADSLAAAGIRYVTGDLVGDESYFSGDALGFGWNWDDEPYWYTAQIGALSFNDNCVDLRVTAGGQPGDSVRVTMNPPTSYVLVENSALTTHADSLSSLSISRERGQNVILVSGKMPAGADAYSTSITVEDPALWYLDNLATTLALNDLEIAGDIVSVDKPLTMAEMVNREHLFSHNSPPLSEIIKVINKPSHNFYAEQALKTLGAEFKKEGSAGAGADVVEAWLGSIGVSEAQAIIYDGSGLSRHNMISPFATAALLRHMYASRHFDVFFESLPIAGVDGTLSRRMKNSPAEGRVHAKTGYVNHVRCLSGYAKDLAGNDYVFVMMMNHYSVPTSYINKLQDKIAIRLSSFHPDAAR